MELVGLLGVPDGTRWTLGESLVELVGLLGIPYGTRWTLGESLVGLQGTVSTFLKTSPSARAQKSFSTGHLVTSVFSNEKYY